MVTQSHVCARRTDAKIRFIQRKRLTRCSFAKSCTFRMEKREKARERESYELRNLTLSHFMGKVAATYNGVHDSLLASKIVTIRQF